MTGHAIQSGVANNLMTQFACFLWIVDGGKLGVGKVVGRRKQVHQTANIVLAELRHACLHVRPNRSMIDQHITHPFRIQLGTHAGKLRWNATLFAKVQVGRLKILPMLL